MSSDSDWIQNTLEMAAERVSDLSPMVYQRFFAAHPEATELFGNDEGNMIKGHMLNGILFAIMEQAEGSRQPHSASYWASDHVAFGVSMPMVASMFSALIDSLAHCLGEDWHALMALAWRRQIDLMLPHIEGALASPRPIINMSDSA